MQRLLLIMKCHYHCLTLLHLNSLQPFSGTVNIQLLPVYLGFGIKYVISNCILCLIY